MNDMIINKLLENMRLHRLRYGSLYPPTVEEWEAINTRLGPIEPVARSHDGKVLYRGIWVRLDDQTPRQRSKILSSVYTITDPSISGLCNV
jgi:hypothetical protein